MKPSAWRHALAGCLVLVLAGLAYAPGLPGPFVFDDFNNITQNPQLRIETLEPAALWSAARSGSAGVGRPLAMLTFALSYYLAGGSYDPFSFKLANLLIHLLNALLVYALTALLLRRLAGAAAGPPGAGRRGPYLRYLPLLAAVLWALHPIQLTSVLYVVQRMTSMAALFLLGGLILFVLGRGRLGRAAASGLALMAGGVAGGALLGVGAKENAALLPLLALLVELFFFTRDDLDARARRLLLAFYGLTVLAPAAFAAGLLLLHPELISAPYAWREFTLYQRLLSESRVLFFYLGLLFVPHLRAFGLYHGDFAVSTGLLEPWTTALSVIGWAGLLSAALWGLRSRALWGFAILWFVAGHSLESSLIGLELVHEHRNYVPSIGVVVCAAYYVLRLLDRGGADRRLWWPVLAGVVGALAFVTFSRAAIWSDRDTLAYFAARNHPRASRALGLYAVTKITRGDDLGGAYNALRDAAAANPATVNKLLEMAKIISGLQAMLQQNQAGEAARARPAEAGPLLARELVMSPQWLSQTARLLHREIAQRLRQYAISPETTRSLVELQMCARANVDVCAPLLDKVREWHLIALDNPRAQAVHRAWLALSLAKLYASRGELLPAVDYARRAVSFAPQEIGVALHLAALYVILDRLQPAEEIIRGLEQRAHLTAFWAREVAEIRQFLERARFACVFY